VRKSSEKGNILIESEHNILNLDSFEEHGDSFTDQQYEKIEVQTTRQQKNTFGEGTNLPDVLEASDESDSHDDSLALMNSDIIKHSSDSSIH
jgi:hypothetical protein